MVMKEVMNFGLYDNGTRDNLAYWLERVKKGEAKVVDVVDGKFVNWVVVTFETCEVE